MARLIIETGDTPGMVFPLNNKPFTIGRSEHTDLQIRDRRVSRQHAQIRPYRDNYIIQDLNSRNGTTLNDTPLTAPTPLQHTDTIIIGGTLLTFENEPSKNKGPLSRVRLTPLQDRATTAEQHLDTDTTPINLHSIPYPPNTKDPNQRLHVIYQVSDSLRTIHDINTLLNRIMESIWQYIHPHRAIILINDNTDSLQPLQPALVKLRHQNNDEIIISQGVVNRSIQQKTAILISDATSDVRFSENASIHSGTIQSIMCTPLIANGKSLGAIYVDTQYGPSGHSFTREDLDLMTGITNQAALALDNLTLHQNALQHQRTQRELEIAHEIQSELLPQSNPHIPGIDLAAICQPARKVGGDYYDFFPAPDNQIAIIVADATGKGVPAALFISMLRSYIRAYINTNTHPTLDKTVQQINNAICNEVPLESYTTLFILLYNPQTRQFTYVNAGHPPPILLRKNGTIQHLATGGLLIGVQPDTIYQTDTQTLHPGDILLIYSDGLTETHNLANQMYTEQELLQQTIQNQHHNATTIRNNIHQSVTQFRETREMFDDLTLLVIKATENNP